MTYKILRALCVFFLLPVILFSGCSSKEDISKEDMKITVERKEITADFSSDFLAHYRDMEIKGHISANRQKMLNIQIISPPSLGGLEIGYKNTELNITRDNMVCSADEAYIPQSSFPNILKTLFSDIADNRAVFKSKKDNENTYEMKTTFGNAVIKADDEGRMQCIELESEKFDIEFG